MMSLAMMLNVHAPITPKQEGVLLSVSILSDTHIDARLPLGRLLLARALDDSVAHLNIESVMNDRFLFKFHDFSS